MKKIKTILVLILILTFNYSFSQKSKVVKEWIMKDTLFISQVTKAYNTSTKKLFEVLEVDDDELEKLGYDYFLNTNGNGKGYISFHYKILYLKNEIVAYELVADIPDELKKTRELYKEKLSKLFDVNNNFEVKPIKVGIKKTFQSLNPKTNAPKEIRKIMSPFIGVTYGGHCGFAGRLLSNRELFNKVIKPSNCQILLYSINPATRIMAIEYFYCNRSSFNSKQIIEIEKRVKEIERQVPFTRTCSGCLFGEDLTKEIVKKLKNCK
ncbi:hypothetical protein [uncultured Tenacibaculum sp.]|uniref:hypothetical protein n=1 Tax=uncultured Tenacibaculum sp. TaxID=174713 RepID=UPI00262FA107|nr:hypothetical protein [uncultured Tenacibaculum sp.]